MLNSSVSNPPIFHKPWWRYTSNKDAVVASSDTFSAIYEQVREHIGIVMAMEQVQYIMGWSISSI